MRDDDVESRGGEPRVQGSASHDDEDDYDYGDDTNVAVDKERKNPGTFH